MPEKFEENLQKLMEMLGVTPGAPAPAPGESPAEPMAPPADGGAAPPAEAPPAAPAAPPATEQPFRFESVVAPKKPEGPQQASLEMLRDVTLQAKIELGRARMRVQDVLKLGTGSIIELDRLTGDPLDVYVNGVLVARGEVIVINENFALRVTELVSPDEAKKRSPEAG